MSFYSEVAEDARQLLQEFGAQAQLRRAGYDTYDPQSGTTTPDDPPDTAVFAIMVDYDAEYRSRSLVQVGDKRVFMSVPTGVPPRLSDQFVWMDGVWTIIEVVDYAPAGVAVLYELQVRK